MVAQRHRKVLMNSIIPNVFPSVVRLTVAGKCFPPPSLLEQKFKFMVSSSRASRHGRRCRRFIRSGVQWPLRLLSLACLKAGSSQGYYSSQAKRGVHEWQGVPRFAKTSLRARRSQGNCVTSQTITHSQTHTYTYTPAGEESTN